MNWRKTFQSYIAKLPFKRTPQVRFLFFLISDILIITASLYLSFFIRFEFSLPAQHLPNIPYYLSISLFTLLPIFYLKRLYHFTWIYVSINDLINIFKAVIYGFLFLGCLLFITREHSLSQYLPRSIILIDFFLTFTLVAGLRVSKRLCIELFRKSPRRSEKPRLLLIGAGDVAEQLIRSIKLTPDYPFHLAGVLDDSDIKQKTNIHNIKVLGKIKHLPRIGQQQNIYGIIIALPKASSREIKKIVDLAQKCNISYIKTLPTLTQFVSHHLSIKDVRDIDVEDLLGRQKINISYNQIEQLIKDKVILITGAAGSIGFELVRQISKLSPQKIIALDMDETGIFNVATFLQNSFDAREGAALEYHPVVMNILQKDKVNALFAKFQPDVVFHAAAYKHVKLMEEQPDEAVLNNILGTWNIVESAQRHQVEKFIFISTDKAVNPTSVMGMTKRIAEMLLMYYDNVKTKFIAVRFGNVLGSRGSVVPLFKQQILSGGPVTVTDPKMERYFMIPSEAILLVLQAAYLGQGKEIFVLDMGEPVKILHLAETMIRLAGFEPNLDIPIVFTRPAPGEKLFEEILTDQENTEATKHEKIFIARNENPFEQKNFFELMENLIILSKKGRLNEIKEELKKITALVL